MSYDTWKTASPYDNDPDWVEEGEKYIKRHPPQNEQEAEVIAIIEGLMDFIEKNI